MAISLRVPVLKLIKILAKEVNSKLLFDLIFGTGLKLLR
jgi:hypothetical protein